MAIVTVGELLDRGRDFETRLEAYYAEIRDRSTDNGVRLVTYYLARHRRHQAMALGGMAAEVLARVRNVELKFDAAFDPTKELRLPEIAPEAIKGDELIECAARHDGQLVSLYRFILGQPLNDDVRAVLEALIRVEERDMVMLKKMLAMHYF
jgi:hypothetical protein